MMHYKECLQQQLLRKKGKTKTAKCNTKIAVFTAQINAAIEPIENCLCYIASLVTGLPSSVCVVCCASLMTVSVYRAGLTKGEI